VSNRDPRPSQVVSSDDAPAEISARGYLAVVQRRLRRIGETQLPEIERAAGFIASAIEADHRLWVAKISHCLLDELTFRAGGLIALHQLTELIALEPGDVVIAGTPAGTATHAIEVAEIANHRGATLIVLTQMDFETHPDTVIQHPNGKRLHEYADVLIDLGGRFGDGESTLPDSAVRVFPSSGVTVMTAVWMMLAEATHQLIVRGKLPLVYQSILVPGAVARNAAEQEAYLRTRSGYRTIPHQGGDSI
jgi:uncharacterized phosphosugar-binding protein